MTRSPNWLCARCFIGSDYGSESTETICLVPRTSCCLGTRRSYSSMDASGTGTVTANLPICRNLAFNSGVKNLTATWQEIVNLSGCCGQWDGESLLFGNANCEIPRDSRLALHDRSSQVRSESREGSKAPTNGRFPLADAAARGSSGALIR